MSSYNSYKTDKAKRAKLMNKYKGNAFINLFLSDAVIKERTKKRFQSANTIVIGKTKVSAYNILAIQDAFKKEGLNAPIRTSKYILPDALKGIKWNRDQAIKSKMFDELEAKVQSTIATLKNPTISFAALQNAKNALAEIETNLASLKQQENAESKKFKNKSVVSYLTNRIDKIEKLSATVKNVQLRIPEIEKSIIAKKPVAPNRTTPLPTPPRRAIPPRPNEPLPDIPKPAAKPVPPPLPTKPPVRREIQMKREQQAKKGILNKIINFLQKRVEKKEAEKRDKLSAIHKLHNTIKIGDFTIIGADAAAIKNAITVSLKKYGAAKINMHPKIEPSTAKLVYETKNLCERLTYDAVRLKEAEKDRDPEVFEAMKLAHEADKKRHNLPDIGVPEPMRESRIKMR